MTDYMRTYTVILEPTEDGWHGVCLEIPECAAEAPGRGRAYQAVKDAIRMYLRRQFVTQGRIPRRSVVVKHPRFDLRELGAGAPTLR